MKQLSIFSFFLLLFFTACQTDDQFIVNENALFHLLTAQESGIDFKNEVTDVQGNNFLLYEYFYNGAGIGVGDFDKDGLPDLFFAGNQMPNKLYLNQGDLHFKDITTPAGILNDKGWSTGVTVSDVNGDGWLDIYVARSGAPSAYTPENRANLLYINNGATDGAVTFSEKAAEYGIADQGHATHAAFFDYDNDGDLDLYVVNHPIKWRQKTSYTLDEKLTKFDEYTTDKLFRNDGQQKFTDVSKEAGIQAAAFGLSINVTDINQDGWLDIYLTNDYWVPDFLYINQKNGTFANEFRQYFEHLTQFSMGADIQDINNDGLEDILAVDMMPEDNFRWKTHEPPANYDKLELHFHKGYGTQYKRNTLQLNNGEGQFSEIAQLAGIAYTDWSWAAFFADFDNDQWKDAFIANGFRRDYSNWDFMQYDLPAFINKKGGVGSFESLDVLKEIPVQKLQNYIFKNKGDLTFDKKVVDWGFEHETYSNGAVYADLDNDGDLDLVVNNINDRAFVYRNRLSETQKTNYIQFSLESDQHDEAIGTQIIVTTKDGQQFQRYSPYRGFMSSVSRLLHFGLGDNETIDKVEVHWKNGNIQTLTNIAANQVLNLKQSDAQAPPNNEGQTEPPLFKDITAQSGIDYEHIESDYNDFKLEPLIPHMFSCAGPSLATGDFNGDGLEDAYIGASFTEKGVLYQQQQDGTFSPHITKAFAKDNLYEDTDALFFDADGDGDQDLLVVSGSNEYEEGSRVYHDRLYINKGKGNFEIDETALPKLATSASCAKVADYDQDGDLDIFIGGGIVPHKYPLAPASFLLKNEGGKFTDVTGEVMPQVAKIGLLKDALWTDFNQDGWTDLIVVGEWMPITFFKNKKGTGFENVTEQTGLANYTGWWNTIAEGDFDADGDMDYMAGNLGLNSRIKGSPKEPVTLHAKDFDGNGNIDAVLSIFVQGKSYPYATRDELRDQMVFLKSKFLRYEDYADKSVDEIFTAEQLQDALVLQATHFSSSYIQNNGDGTFSLTALPNEVQTAPVNSIVTHDFNGDNHLDVLMVGNAHAANAMIGKHDASIGWYLEGDGKGSFRIEPSYKSGFYVRGDAKNMSLVGNKRSKSKQVMISKNKGKLQILQF